MMDAKKALVEAEGDMEKAAELLRQKGIASADKKWAELQQKVLLQLMLTVKSALWLK